MDVFKDEGKNYPESNTPGDWANAFSKWLLIFRRKEDSEKYLASFHTVAPVFLSSGYFMAGIYNLLSAYYIAFVTEDKILKKSVTFGILWIDMVLRFCCFVISMINGHQKKTFFRVLCLVSVTYSISRVFFATSMCARNIRVTTYLECPGKLNSGFF